MVSKTSRKGKKAWRKNISAKEAEAIVEKGNYEAVQGLSRVPDAALFVVDTGRDDETAAAVMRGEHRRQKEIKKIRSAAILEAVHTGARKPWGLQKAQSAKQKREQVRHAEKQDVAKHKATGPRKEDEALEDLWAGDQGVNTCQQSSCNSKDDNWLDTRDLNEVSKKHAKWRKQSWRSKVPAVEVDIPGCSYNPDDEQRQEAVGIAVADSYKGLLNSSLSSKEECRVVRLLPELKGKDDIDAILGNVSDSEESGAEHQEEGEELVPARKPTSDENRKTRAQRNKEKRARELERCQDAKRALKCQRQQIQDLPSIVKEIKQEEARKAIYRERKRAMRADRELERPPKLGRHKFKPSPLQVLSSDDVVGCLRKLRPTAMLASHHYKSLLKRALVQPVMKTKKGKARRHVWFVPGERMRNARQRQQELEMIKTKTSKMRQAAGIQSSAGNGMNEW